jgi:hypothetical protein
MRRNIGSSAVLGALAVLAVAACAYDFDRFAKSGNSSGGGPAGETGGDEGLGGAENPPGTGGELPTGGIGGNAAVGGAAGDVGGAGGDVGGAGGEAAGGSSSTGYCLDLGGTVHNGHCYRVNATASTIDVAVVSCQNLTGFHLVSVTSSDEATYVTALFSASGKDYWLGLRENRSTYSQKNQANLKWVSGETFDPQTQSNWDNREPSFVGDCVLMHATGKWASVSCDNTSFPFICEHD